MKRTAIAMMVVAAGMLLGSAAYAQGAHDHGTPKSGPGAVQGHDAHCCKPDPSDMKGMQGMAEHTHDHAQPLKKPAAKKPARKPAADAGQNAK
jgi:hypothetical protein